MSDLRRYPCLPTPEGTEEVIAKLPESDCNEILAFLDFFRALAPEERALFVKAAKPDLREGQVARLAGVTRRSLYRYLRYQSFRRAAAKALADSRRRRWDAPDDPAA